MIKNLQSQKGLLFGVSNVTEPANKKALNHRFRAFFLILQARTGLQNVLFYPRFTPVKDKIIGEKPQIPAGTNKKEKIYSCL